jgi:hypothetical protein
VKTDVLNRRMALAFGLAVPALQFGRALLWGRWPQPFGWFIEIDAYVMGALLLSGAVLAGRKAPAGRLVLAAGWGFACGIFYRSFFEQLGEPTRHGGQEIVVLTGNGALLAFAVAGFVSAIRISPPSSEDSPA